MAGAKPLFHGVEVVEIQVGFISVITASLFFQPCHLSIFVRSGIQECVSITHGVVKGEGDVGAEITAIGRIVPEVDTFIVCIFNEVNMSGEVLDVTSQTCHVVSKWHESHADG